jgi:hypothetical protein
MRTAKDAVFRAMGLGFAAMIACVFVVNLFGDRWMYQQLTAYMWIILGLITRAQQIEEEATGVVPERQEESFKGISGLSQNQITSPSHEGACPSY